MSETLTGALRLAAAGIAVVKVAADGSKRPIGEWKQYQERRATEEELRGWFSNGHPAVGVITGAVSGNLEMAEIEGRAAHEMGALQQLADDNGLAGLWIKLCNGWMEQSPSGGYHWFYRLTETPAKNTKLASRPATFEELAINPKEKRKVLTETRGEGGFVVTAPTAGTAHETGRPWTIIAGGPETVPTITGEELEQFHFILASLNVEPEAPPMAASARTTPAAGAGGLFGSVSPLDDYEARTDWEEILIPAGWRHAFTDGAGVRYWTRPGKKWGISATTGKDPARDRLFVFSASTEFETETPYTKPGAYAALNHGGDHAAAASSLRRAGYGQDATIGVTPSQPNLAPGASPFATSAAAPESWAAAETTTSPAASAPTDPWTSATVQPAATTEGNLATVTELAPRIAAGRTIAHTDDGNAALLIANHGHELRYNPDRGRWLHWTGNVWEWQPGTDGAARELAKNTIRGMVTEDDAGRQWKKKSLSASAISNMLAQASTDTRIVVTADQLDARGWELNTPAGIIDLRTAELREPDPESLHTKLAACGPDFEGESELWEQFLSDTFPGNEELREYVQRLIGYSAIGIVREHILPMGIGDGGNGKGVLMETSIAVLGDYATTAPAGFLMKSMFQNHTTDLARLHGARMVVCDEAEPGARWDEAKMKQLVGGSSITARFMRQDNFTFKPTHQLWTTVNHKPGVEAGGDSFWRRLRIVPFLHTVPEEKKIMDLGEILSTEHGPKVLAWIARGAAKYYQQGLAEPDQVRQATKAYAHDVDTIARFLEDECEVDTDAPRGSELYTNCNVLRNAYERYCKSNGDEPIKGRAFQLSLEKHGIVTGTGIAKGANGQRQYRGARLQSSVFFPADTEPPASPFEVGQKQLTW